MLQTYLLLGLNAATLVAAACTKTSTVYKTVTHRPRKTTSSEFPSTTVTSFSSTVLIGTPYTGPRPFSYPDPANPIGCSYSTVGNAAAAAATDVQAREANRAICETVTDTVTVSAFCTLTQLLYPPPVAESGTGVLATEVPDFCTSAPRVAKSNGVGNKIFPLSYPYFAQNEVDCCIFCSEQYYDNVASALLPIECDCLVDTKGDHPGKSDFCPNSIEKYDLGKRSGNALLGRCRKK